jgi:YhcG PDDEXK nuclease domain
MFLRSVTKSRKSLSHLRWPTIGCGFAFVGSQVPLEVADQDRKSKLEWAGKLNFYLSAVDDLFRPEPDAPTIGLLLCESHRSAIVKYTLRSVEKPIGVSSYRVTRELPQPIRGEVPTVEDLQAVVTKLRAEMESLRQKYSDEE